ncbi:hypothetical protein ABW19_dt0206808 [Dactylella cylindrospora]|nr:hypothetical protein ABW19_dt0206808 [Dactylella cylindrospora]
MYALSETDAGRLAKSVTVSTYMEDSRVVDHFAKLWSNLDPGKLSNISTSYEFLSGIDRLTSLKSLSIQIGYSETHNSKIHAFPTLPSLEELSFSWSAEEGEPPFQSYVKVLTIFAVYAARCLNIHRICIKVDVPNLVGFQPSIVNDLDDYDAAVYDLMETLQFPNLWRLVLIIPDTFVYTLVKMVIGGSPRNVYIHEIFHRLISRHKEQIERLYYQEVPDYGTELAHVADAAILPVMPNLERLYLGSDTWAGARIPSSTNKYLGDLVAANKTSLRDLKVTDIQFAAQWAQWVKTLILPFSNLSSLKIHDITIVVLRAPEVSRLAPRPGPHPVFADRNLVSYLLSIYSRAKLDTWHYCLLFLPDGTRRYAPTPLSTSQPELV